MPELPEVQTVADHVKPELVGEHILSIEPVWKKVLDNFNVEEAKGKHKVLNVSRRAKFIIIELENFILGMSYFLFGQLWMSPS